MKKPTNPAHKPLTLATQTVRTLDRAALETVNGGAGPLLYTTGSRQLCL